MGEQYRPIEKPTVRVIDANHDIFRAHVSHRSIELLNKIGQDIGISDQKELLKLCAGTQQWMVEHVFTGRRLFAVKPGDNVAERPVSEILLFAERGETPSKEWYGRYFDDFKSSEHSVSEIYYNFELAEYLDKTAERTGVEFWDILLNHSIVLYAWMRDVISRQMFVAAHDPDTGEVNILCGIDSKLSNDETSDALRQLVNFRGERLPLVAA